MRVLSIAASETGGGKQTVFRISNRFNDKGLEIITAFHSEDESIPDINLKRIGDYRNFVKKVIAYFYISDNYQKIKEYLSNNEVDIIHLHGSVHLSLSLLYAIRKYKGKAKVIYTSHGYGLICPNYSCFNYSKGELCKKCAESAKEIRIIGNKCDKRGYLFSSIRYMDFLLRKKVTDNYKLYDYIVTPSEYLKDILIESRHSFNNVRVIANPIDIDERHMDFHNKKDVITFAGRFSTEKNVDLLIESFAELIKIKKYNKEAIG